MYHILMLKTLQRSENYAPAQPPRHDRTNLQVRGQNLAGWIPGRNRVMAFNPDAKCKLSG
ncbi:MAG: hypothetical protein WCJ26_05200 [bacterium]